MTSFDEWWEAMPAKWVPSKKQISEAAWNASREAALREDAELCAITIGDVYYGDLRKEILALIKDKD